MTNIHVMYRRETVASMNEMSVRKLEDIVIGEKLGSGNFGVVS